MATHTLTYEGFYSDFCIMRDIWVREHLEPLYGLRISLKLQDLTQGHDCFDGLKILVDPLANKSYYYGFMTKKECGEE